MFTLQASAPSYELHEELNKTADIIVKRIESEIAHLEYLLEEAEARSRELEKQLLSAEHIIKTLASSETPQAGYQELSTQLPDKETKASSPDSLSLNVEANMEKRNLVAAMAEQGYSITEIAKALGIGKGEVILLLQLHKK